MSANKLQPPPEHDLNVFERQFPELGKWFRLLADMFNPPIWREIGDTAGKNPIFQNSWDNVGAPYADTGFYKDGFGIVRLQGRIDSGSTDTIAFTLPAGYRPSAELAFTAHNSAGGPGPGGAAVYITVQADGDVIPTFSGGSDAALDGISFRVAL